MVKNPSFEILYNCPSNLGELNTSKFWYVPNNSSPDLFNKCSTVWLYSPAIPQNTFGYQYAHTDSGYVGIGIAPSFREYISTKLTDSLISGNTYCISFYVNLADSCQIAFGAFGVYFSKDSISDKSTGGYLPFTPQFENPATNYVIDKVNWTNIRGEYVAQGGERFITIGNFNNDGNTLTLNVDSTKYNFSYYYIDDVSITDCTVGIEESGVNKKIKINYSDGQLFVKSDDQVKRKSILIIYDLAGSKIHETSLPFIENVSTQIQLPVLPVGMYIYRLEIENNGVKAGKFIVPE